MRGDGEAIGSRRRVGIIGGNAPDPGSLKTAEEMGRLIAESGHILINGGMGGVMEASARGARSAGGLVVAILPGFSREDSNPHVDIAIPTGLGYMRNVLVVLNADVLVAIDGRYGTLSEIAYARIYGKTVFGLNTWDIEGVIPLDDPETAMERINAHLVSRDPH